ncbi:MAG: hypothetical protein NVV74_14850 [Magnetospirillum sp.]|nr:hypothetical protein [Magnetospirillum sp.]
MAWYRRPALLFRIVGIAAQGGAEVFLGVGAHHHGDDVVHRAAAAQADEIVADRTPLGVHQQVGEGVAPLAEDEHEAVQQVRRGQHGLVELGAVHGAEGGDERAKHGRHRALEGVGDLSHRRVVLHLFHVRNPSAPLPRPPLPTPMGPSVSRDPGTAANDEM